MDWKSENEEAEQQRDELGIFGQDHVKACMGNSEVPTLTIRKHINLKGFPLLRSSPPDLKELSEGTPFCFNRENDTMEEASKEEDSEKNQICKERVEGAMSGGSGR